MPNMPPLDTAASNASNERKTPGIMISIAKIPKGWVGGVFGHRGSIVAGSYTMQCGLGGSSGSWQNFSIKLKRRDDELVLKKDRSERLTTLRERSWAGSGECRDGKTVQFQFNSGDSTPDSISVNVRPNGMRTW